MKDDRTAPGATDNLLGDAPARGRFGQRASKCADEAWARELVRIWAMTPQERMLEALDLDEETEALLAGIGRARR